MGSPWYFTVSGRLDSDSFRSCISSRARLWEFKEPKWGFQVFSRSRKSIHSGLLLFYPTSPRFRRLSVLKINQHLFSNRLCSYDQEPVDLFTPSMTIITSKWSQSLKNLNIHSSRSSYGVAHQYAISKCLTLLMDLHEMQTFHLKGWRMENMDDDVRCLVKSWPKLRTLTLPLDQTFISLSTLRIIAKKCPELRYLRIPLDTSTIPPFNTYRKSFHHKLEVLAVGRVHPST